MFRPKYWTKILDRNIGPNYGTKTFDRDIRPKYWTKKLDRKIVTNDILKRKLVHNLWTITLNRNIGPNYWTNWFLNIGSKYWTENNHGKSQFNEKRDWIFFELENLNRTNLNLFSDTLANQRAEKTKIINHSFCNQYNAFQSFQYVQPFEPLAFYSLVFLLVNLDQSDWSILDQSEKRNERSLKFSARPGRSITLPIKKSVHPKTQILTNQIQEPIENQNFWTNQNQESLPSAICPSLIKITWAGVRCVSSEFPFIW